VRNANYEAPHYAVVSILLQLPAYNALCFRTVIYGNSKAMWAEFCVVNLHKHVIGSVWEDASIPMKDLFNSLLVGLMTLSVTQIIKRPVVRSTFKAIPVTGCGGL
jgi:hypothetical protein